METENPYKEKRKYSRQLFYDNVYLTNEGGAYLGTALNYSSGGIYITTDRAVNIGVVLFISFPRPENMDRMSKETAVVVRKERRRRGRVNARKRSGKRRILVCVQA